MGQNSVPLQSLSFGSYVASIFVSPIIPETWRSRYRYPIWYRTLNKHKRITLRKVIVKSRMNKKLSFLKITDSCFLLIHTQTPTPIPQEKFHMEETAPYVDPFPFHLQLLIQYPSIFSLIIIRISFCPSLSSPVLVIVIE